MKSATAPMRQKNRSKRVEKSSPTTTPVTPSISAFQRATNQYQLMRSQLTQVIPGLSEILPTNWPQNKPEIDVKKTIALLRSVTSTLNEGLLIVGFGDGSIIDHLRQDLNARKKLIQILVLESEAEAFAHALGAIDMQGAFNELHLDINYVRTIDDLMRILSTLYANHGQIARLAGTTILDNHPLIPSAEQQRQAWMPMLRKIILERYDCLGNDVYDTFLGAKHALMHGDKLIRQRRSSDYLKRYLGKSALCIASGPSIANYYDHIRAIQHEHVVICADSILGGLLNHGVEPDFVCMVERPDSMHRLIDDHAATCKTVMVALPVVHPTSVKPFEDRVMWWWNADDLYPWLDPKETLLHSGRSAGTITAAVAGMLGVKTAYLIGHDLAFKDGQSHGPGANAMALETQSTINKELSRNNPNYYRRILDVAQNGGGKIETMGVWDIFRSDLESIIHSYNTKTTFININIPAKVGAVITGALAGDLPQKTGEALTKSHPEKKIDDTIIPAYRKRCLKLLDEFDLIKKEFEQIGKELETWQPLSHDRKAVEAMGVRVDLTKIVSKENSAWFGYVFRAALRNLMVRLHHNSYVRTMAERNWNQVQIIRLYTESIPSLLDRLRPELEAALENMK